MQGAFGGCHWEKQEPYERSVLWKAVDDLAEIVIDE